jgi:fido (protein-threonine AMPylation protein)
MSSALGKGGRLLEKGDAIMSEFEISYEIQTEPDRVKRVYNWKTATGLQAVDGLVPTDYLHGIAKANIEGEISIDKAENMVTNYYKDNPPSNLAERRNREADIVSARIAQILSNQTFTLHITDYLWVHEHLFKGLYDFAGKMREMNIRKQEVALNGASVQYADYRVLKTYLEHDFSAEKAFDYSNFDKVQTIRRMERFLVNIWSAHPFMEGNTRTAAVFFIRYLGYRGYNTTNDMFEQHANFFRDALVRASYNHIGNDVAGHVKETFMYLDFFFDNLLFGGKHDLKSLDLNIKAQDKPKEGGSEKP